MGWVVHTRNLNILVNSPEKISQTSSISCTLVGNNLVYWLLRCSWSIACRRCSNYIFILDLTPGSNRLGKDNCKMRWVTFNFFLFGASYTRGLTECNVCLTSFNAGHGNFWHSLHVAGIFILFHFFKCPGPWKINRAANFCKLTSVTNCYNFSIFA